MEKDLLCKHCERYLGKAYGSIVAELRCSNSSCKGTTHFKIVQADMVKDLKFKFTKPEQQPKKKEVEVS